MTVALFGLVSSSPPRKTKDGKQAFRRIPEACFLLYNFYMNKRNKITVILGLTGGIGMGKSTIAQLCRDKDIPVFSADQYIHRALNKNGVGVAAVRSTFPKSYNVATRKIDRAQLGQIIFNDFTFRKKLEAILHPIVRAAELRFIARHQKKQTPLIILDIPLLFETKADRFCTAVMVVSAPAYVQRERVLSRRHMTLEKFKAIKRAQMSNSKRLAKADYILDTDATMADTKRNLQRLLKQIQKDHA